MILLEIIDAYETINIINIKKKFRSKKKTKQNNDSFNVNFDHACE